MFGTSCRCIAVFVTGHTGHLLGVYRAKGQYVDIKDIQQSSSEASR